MSEHPIIFSGPMMRAILAGKKTQTRRVLKVQPLDIIPMEGEYAGTRWMVLMSREPNRGKVMRCRFGDPGDRLWVRETWRHYANEYCDGKTFAHVKYAADEAKRVIDISHIEDPPVRSWWNTGRHPWQASIFMPRWASRLLLEITDVRVQRVQEITGEDCEAEGMTAFCDDGVHDPGDAMYAQFRDLWDSINAKRGYPWSLNPWVWAISFRVAKEAK